MSRAPTSWVQVPRHERVRQTKRHIQHIVLVVSGLLEHVVVLWCENDMARRTRDAAFACAFHVNVVLVCEVQQRVAFVALDCFQERV